MGSVMRKLNRKRKDEKSSDGKVLGGKSRLTDKIIDKIQNYYEETTRNSTGVIKGMESSILAIFKHMIRDESIV